MSFTGPAGALTPTGSTWLDNVTLQVTFAQQRESGSYEMVIGPNITDAQGREMDQDQDGASGEGVDDRYTAAFDIGAALSITEHAPTGDVEGPVSHVDVAFSEAIIDSTFTADDVTAVGPQGAINVFTAPTLVSGTTYRVRFAAQDAVGEYHVYVGPDIENLSNVVMNQDGDSVVGELDDDRYDAGFTIIDLRGPRVVSHAPAQSQNTPIGSMTVLFNETIDASTFTVADVTITGPDGSPVEATGVTSINTTTFRIDFATQSAEGPYAVTIGPNVSDPAGNLMDQDADGQKGEAADDQYHAQLVIDLTPPQVTGHWPMDVQNVPLTSFDLDFSEAMDPTSFSNDAVTITTPAGDTLDATGVSALDADTCRVSIPATASEGVFHVVVQPSMTDLASNPLDQDGDGDGGEAVDDTYGFDFVQQLPDLTITNVSVPVEAVAGQQIDVVWTVTNQGQGTASGSWADLAYLSEDAALDPNDTAGRLTFNQPLPPGESYTRALTLTVPADAPGNLWLFVRADVDGDLAETDEDNNSGAADTALFVTSRPYPDLQVSDLVGPATLKAGDLATFSWTVRNMGDGPTDASVWYDALYLSSDATFDFTDVYLDHRRNPEFLGAGESYSQTFEVVIPADTPQEPFYVLAKADSTDALEEFDLEDNNVAATATTMNVVVPGGAVLTVTDIAEPDPIGSGDYPSFTWTVTNTGDSSIWGNWWDDGLALSRDNTYEANEDYWLGSHNDFTGTPLRPGQSYTLTGTAEHSVPAWEPGTYYVIVVPDTHFYAGADFGQSTIPRTYGAQAVELQIPQPADLVVTDVVAPASATSGLPLGLGWTVSNQGGGRTHVTDWLDGVYLSTDQALDAGDIQVGLVQQAGELRSGESYQQASMTLETPRGLSGDYYLIIHADDGGLVYEIYNTNNATASSAVVPITLLQSDLAPTVDSAPTSGRSGRTIDVTYSVENAGPDDTALGQWTDAVYLSADDTFSANNDVLLGTFPYSAGGSLAANDPYQRTQTVDIARGIEGTFYLFVVTDVADTLYEHNAEGNNAAMAAEPIGILDLAPDLDVTSFVASATGIAGEPIDLTWQVQNNGTEETTSSWWDRIYLSQDDTLEIGVDTLLNSAPVDRSQDALDIGESYGDSGPVALPEGIDGDYYLFYHADADGAVYEKGADANNIGLVGPITITDLKPNLQVQSATVPATGTSRQIIDVDFSIVNAGEEVAAGSWQDAFYLSTDTTFDAQTDLLFALLPHTGPVKVSSDYGPDPSPAQLRLPDRIDGQYYVFILPDWGDQVPEQDDADAYMVPEPIDVTYLPADLQVTSVGAPAATIAGAAITVEWTVENAGLAATGEMSWKDGVYLSADATFAPAGDIELGLVSRVVGLGAGESYSVSRTFTLWQDLEGPYYVYVVTDARRQVYEHTTALEENNTTAATPQMDVAGVHADLQVTSFTAPADGDVGDRIDLSWTVANTGRDTTAALSWSDAVYLSSDATLDPADVRLDTFPHDGPLAPGEIYTQHRSVALPDGLTGSLFLLVKTDSAAENNVYEYRAENNNVALSAFSLSDPPPPDLQVTEVQSPASAWSGQNLHVEWTVTNMGQAEAVGTPRPGWGDSVYLSRDPYLDKASDVYLRSVAYHGTLEPGAAYAAPQSLDVRIPSGISGPYYVLVATRRHD